MNASAVLSKALKALKTNALPAVILWITGFLLVFSYYRIPAARNFMQDVATFRSRWGFRFSLISTAIFGGVLPSLFQYINPRTRNDINWPFFLFFVFFWGYKGVEIDAFYRFQGWLFGDVPGLGVVIKKVAVDQMIYTPLWAVPSVSLAYIWKDQRFPSWSRFQRNPRYFKDQYFPVLLFNWGVWVPAVALLYCFPLALQMPVQNLVLCLFSLMLVIMTRPEENSSES